jgi:hypothetical protein
LSIVPWVLRNWIWIGNPVAPFANRWFPNQYFHPGMEAMYLSDLRHYPDLRGLRIAWELLVHGRGTGGIVGPVFVLAPLGLLALRRREGRQLLAAAAVFAVPAYLNTGARFLIPALPFVALAMTLATARFPALLLTFVVAAGMAGWPNVMARYTDPNAWRLNSIPVAAALRIVPEQKYLDQHLTDYSWKSGIEGLTPPNAKLFTLEPLPEAYFDRTIVVGYESSVGDRVIDLLATPLDHRLRPEVRRSFRFLPLTTKAVRLVETTAAAGYWPVNELHVLFKGAELPRADSWRVRAWPNGWDARFGFDNSYATRWSSWQSMAYGMFLAVDFGNPQMIDEVKVDQASTAESKVQVEVLDAGGHWIPLTDSAETVPLDIPSGLRRAATLAMKRDGMGYLFVRNTDFFADDMRANASYWGVTELRRTERAALYLIQ